MTRPIPGEPDLRPRSSNIKHSQKRGTTMLGLLLKVAGTVVVTNVVAGIVQKELIKNDTVGPAIADAYMKQRKLIEEQAAKYKPKVKGLNLFGKETAAQADKIIADLAEKIRAGRQQNGGTPPDAA